MEGVARVTKNGFWDRRYKASGDMEQRDNEIKKNYFIAGFVVSTILYIPLYILFFRK